MSRTWTKAPLVAVLILLAACGSTSSSSEGADAAGDGAASTTTGVDASDAGTGHEAEIEEGHEGAAKHWSYEGETGPKHWSTLEGGEACGGSEQSPIDLTDAEVGDLPDLDVDYADEIPLALFHNGHTVQVAAASGGSLTTPEGTFPLAQFHFHAGAEHTIDGKRAPLELHLVHVIAGADVSQDRIAVVGVMFEVDDDEENEALADVFDNLPTTVAAKAQPVEGATVDLDAILPERANYYRYDGSLTTPPCTQGVDWHVITDPITISTAQLEAFTDVMEGNYRPTLPLGERSLTEDVTPAG